MFPRARVFRFGDFTALNVVDYTEIVEISELYAFQLRYNLSRSYSAL